MAAFTWRRPAVVMLCALAFLASGAAGPDGALPGSRETLTKEIPLARGGRLALDNSLGDVTIRSWNREMVELRAEKSADSAGDLAELPIEIHAVADALTITSRAPVYRPDLRVRVDYRLRVPADTDLKLVKADRGQVIIEGVVGRAAVRVINGAVRIRGFGVLDVSTLNVDEGHVRLLELASAPGGGDSHVAPREPAEVGVQAAVCADISTCERTFSPGSLAMKFTESHRPWVALPSAG